MYRFLKYDKYHELKTWEYTIYGTSIDITYLIKFQLSMLISLSHHRKLKSLKTCNVIIVDTT